MRGPKEESEVRSQNERACAFPLLLTPIFFVMSPGTRHLATAARLVTRQSSLLSADGPAATKSILVIGRVSIPADERTRIGRQARSWRASGKRNCVRHAGSCGLM